MNLPSSPSDLSYFVELSKIQNISRASERIGISQPSLSLAIRRLEEAIGVPLFVRHKNGVTLTPAGRRLLAHAREMLQLWSDTRTAALNSHAEVEGEITVGCHASLALLGMTTVIPQIMSKYPKLEVSLIHDLSKRLIEKIINMSIDIGVLVNPVNHPDLVIVKLMNDKVTFWKHASLTGSDGDVMGGNATLICDPDMIQVQDLLRRAKKLGITFKRMVTSSNLEVIADLVAHGGGIGILPGSVVKSPCVKANLKPLNGLPGYGDEICLVYRHENRQIQSIFTFIEATKKQFKGI